MTIFIKNYFIRNSFRIYFEQFDMLKMFFFFFGNECY